MLRCASRTILHPHQPFLADIIHERSYPFTCPLPLRLSCPIPILPVQFVFLKPLMALISIAAMAADVFDTPEVSRSRRSSTFATVSLQLLLWGSAPVLAAACWRGTGGTAAAVCHLMRHALVSPFAIRYPSDCTLLTLFSSRCRPAAAPNLPPDRVQLVIHDRLVRPAAVLCRHEAADEGVGAAMSNARCLPEVGSRLVAPAQTCVLRRLQYHTACDGLCFRHHTLRTLHILHDVSPVSAAGSHPSASSAP